MHAARGNAGFRGFSLRGFWLRGFWLRGFWLRGFWLRGLDATFTAQAVTFNSASEEDLSRTVSANLLAEEAPAANRMNRNGQNGFRAGTTLLGSICPLSGRMQTYLCRTLNVSK
jgi:hypothetical protein